MLLHPTLEKLTTLRFSGMAAALEEQMKMDGLQDIGFEERLGLLLDHEQAVRDTRRLKTRLSKAVTSVFLFFMIEFLGIRALRLRGGQLSGPAYLQRSQTIPTSGWTSLFGLQISRLRRVHWRDR